MKTYASRRRLAAALAVGAAGIGLVTCWVALSTRSWDELEGVLVLPLALATALGVVWACVLAAVLVRHPDRAGPWALATFLIVSVCSGLALFDVAQRVADGTAPVRHLGAPGGLFALATGIVLLTVRPEPRWPE